MQRHSELPYQNSEDAYFAPHPPPPGINADTLKSTTIVSANGFAVQIEPPQRPALHFHASPSSLPAATMRFSKYESKGPGVAKRTIRFEDLEART